MLCLQRRLQPSILAPVSHLSAADRCSRCLVPGSGRLAMAPIFCLQAG